MPTTHCCDLLRLETMRHLMAVNLRSVDGSAAVRFSGISCNRKDRKCSIPLRADSLFLAFSTLLSCSSYLARLSTSITFCVRKACSSCLVFDHCLDGTGLRRGTTVVWTGWSQVSHLFAIMWDFLATVASHRIARPESRQWLCAAGLRGLQLQAPIPYRVR